MFTLKLEIKNAAFADDPKSEIVRILLLTAKWVEDGSGSGLTLRDINGNEVGFAYFEPDL